MDFRSILLLIVFGLPVAGHSNSCVDTDGNGWGWDGSASCRVGQGVSNTTGSGEAACIDTDGNGWGWDGSASCRVGQVVSNTTGSAGAACIDTDGNGWGWDGSASCRVGQVVSNTTGSAGAACIDTDGNGWGWDGSSSCRVEQANNDNTSDNTSDNEAAACVDADGDGWGWNGSSSCRSDTGSNSGTNAAQNSGSLLDPLSPVFNDALSAVPENCVKLDSGNYHITELVTDVFLTAGQSNAAGANTHFEPHRIEKDRINSRAIAWTEENIWEIADPQSQTWHNGKFPTGRNVVSNHPAFQIGRAITGMDECRVVAFIATAASGKEINHWLHNVDDHYSHITDTVSNAINSLPNVYRVDMIWWMQGESDNEENISIYSDKLNNLISNFRSESWFPADSLFLANETGWHLHANRAIRLLRYDDDLYTDYSRGEDSALDPFYHILTNENKGHFNEVSLRKIGDLVADKYLHYSNSLVSRSR